MIIEGQQIPECKQCGACCAGWEVDVFSHDLVKIERAEKRLKRSLVVDRVWDVTMKTSGESKRCIALRGRIGRETSCAIYRERPNTCRDFKRGSDSCLLALGRAQRRGWR